MRDHQPLYRRCRHTPHAVTVAAALLIFGMAYPLPIAIMSICVRLDWCVA